jgi:Domain of unknown function (DUF1840)
MLYRFTSQATADLVMLEADAKAALRLMGKALTPQGVVTPDQLAQAIAVLQRAAQEDRAMRRQEDAPGQQQAADEDVTDPDVRLSQRLVPLLNLLELARGAGKAVVWSDS